MRWFILTEVYSTRWIALFQCEPSNILWFRSNSCTLQCLLSVRIHHITFFYVQIQVIAIMINTSKAEGFSCPCQQNKWQTHCFFRCSRKRMYLALSGRGERQGNKKWQLTYIAFHQDSWTRNCTVFVIYPAKYDKIWNNWLSAVTGLYMISHTTPKSPANCELWQ